MRGYPDESDPGTMLASFGDARLIQFLDTRVELVGGTEADRKAAGRAVRARTEAVRWTSRGVNGNAGVGRWPTRVKPWEPLEGPQKAHRRPLEAHGKPTIPL